MSRKVLAMFLLTFLVFTFVVSTAFGADQAIKRAKDQAKMAIRHAPVYGFAGAEAGEFASYKGSKTATLGEVSTNAVGLQLGTTTYDYQHNCTMGRQVAHRNTNYVHFDWMHQELLDLGDPRGVAVNSYDLIGCALVNTSGGWLANVDYAGYVSLDADQGGCALPGAHENNGRYRPVAYFDFCTGGPMGLFTQDFPPDKETWGYYVNNGTGPDNENIWPVIDLQVGASLVLHMVCCESGGAAGDPQTIGYYRRVGAYSAGVGVWSDQRLIDTVMNINPTVTSSTTTGKVAIAWNAPADYLRDTPDEFSNQYENDVWYVECIDQGLAWVTDQGSGSLGHEVDIATETGANITTYGDQSDYNAYCDISALITTNDEVHVVWGGRRWEWDGTDYLLYRRSSGIFHWSTDNTMVRPVVIADWDTGGECYAHAWGADVAKMSISECAGKLYVLYTQFGNATDPCYDLDVNNQTVNGELYMTASNDGGANWDKAQNLTNTVTHDCATGDCESDYWATMSRYGRTETCGPLVGTDVLDIIYINDREAGGVVQADGGIWTTNPVMWLNTPCRDVVVEPLYNDDGGPGWGECAGGSPLTVLPGTDTTVNITMWNPGLEINNVSYAVDYSASPYSGWITSSNFPTNLPLGGAVQSADFVIADPPVASDPEVIEAVIIITHDADNSPRNIPVCLMVSSSFYYPQNAILHTACKDMRVFNNGDMVNDANGAGLDFNDDPDTFNSNTNSAIYLYQGSPMVVRLDGPDDTLRFTMYSNTYTDDDGMRQMTDLWVDSVNSDDYTYATSDFVTADSLIGITVEYFAPKAVDTCDFVVVVQHFYNKTDVTLPGVFVGDILDWDIPSDSGSNNGAGFDVPTNLIYQFGGEYNQDDSTEALGGNQEADDRWGGVFIEDGSMSGIKNLMTIDNATYIYTTGPYNNDAPLPPGAMYQMMTDNDGFGLWSSTDPDSVYVDLSTLLTWGPYDLEPHSSGNFNPVTVVKIFMTGKDGLGGWAAHKAKIDDWLTKYVKPTTPTANPEGINLHNDDAAWRPTTGTPIGTNWTELYSSFGVQWPCTSWDDNDANSKLSVGDSLDFNGDPKKYEVLWIGPTITVTPYWHPEIDIYLDYVGMDNQDVVDVANPIGTFWHEVYPTYCETFRCIAWFDDGDGILGNADYIVLQNVAGYFEEKLYSVEDFRTDLVMDPGGCCDTPGDANNDGGANLGDAGFIINYIFYSGPAPTCNAEGDANGDGGVNLGDAGFIINYIFYSGPSPSCGPE